ncbi:MAG: glycosyltransferase family 4 protein [Treponema sp.]|jgi:glycosyltransferase involved in cell wall biosynthesis|nr:glycosyltransferase family 4 protein [Treponema sp.]
MKIAVDCRSLDSSGVGVYLRGCLPYFLASAHDFLLIGPAEKIRPLTEGRRNCSILDCSVKPFSPAELFFFPAGLRKAINRSDCYFNPFFNIPPFISVPVYTTIHDIIFPDVPGLTSPPGLALRMFFYKRAARLSNKIFTVSFFSKSRIEFYLGSSKPVVVTYSALQPYLLRPPFFPFKKNNSIIFIGNIKKHKGLGCLLESFNRLKRAYPPEKGGFPFKLVIVGGQDSFRTRDAEISRMLSGAEYSAVEFSGYVDNEKLRELLGSAVLLVQPSLYEGFGLPPLEAMVLGTRALISDIPVFREIYAGFPVTFFRAGDPLDLEEKMRSLLDEDADQPLALPEHLALKYTFEKTSSIILREITGG